MTRLPQRPSTEAVEDALEVGRQCRADASAAGLSCLAIAHVAAELASELLHLRIELAELSDERDTVEAYSEHLKDRLKLPRNKLAAELTKATGEVARLREDLRSLRGGQ